MKQFCASTAGQPMPKTLPDHLHRMEAMETARLEQLRQITPAVEELYGTLNAKQKEMADHMVEHMMQHGPGPGMHPSPMSGRGGPPAPRHRTDHGAPRPRDGRAGGRLVGHRDRRGGRSSLVAWTGRLVLAVGGIHI